MKRLMFLMALVPSINAFTQVKPVQKKPLTQIVAQNFGQGDEKSTVQQDETKSANPSSAENKIWMQLWSRPSIFYNLVEDKNRVVELKQRKEKISADLNISKLNDPNIQPKGTFETTEAYEARMKITIEEQVQKQKLIVRQIDDEIASLNNRFYTVNNKSFNALFKLDQYNADLAIWKIKLKEDGIDYPLEISIKPQQAQVLWSNLNFISYSVLTKLENNPEDLVYCISYSKQHDPICLQSRQSNHNSSSTDDDDIKIFTKLEVEADFLGGVNAWRRFLANNLDSEVPGSNGAPPGQYTVVVRFIVAKDGSVSDIQAETAHGYGMEQESVRVIKKSGNWRPGSQGGRNVISYKRQPITWVVSEK